MKKQYLVRLTAEQRAGLKAMLRRGVAPARTLIHARILRRADDGGSDRAIAAGRDIHPRTGERTRRRLVADGLPRALHDQPRPGGRPTRDDNQEAVLVALACSQPPQGYARWTMPLPAAPGPRRASMMKTAGVIPPISFSCCSSRTPDGAMSR